MPLYSQAYLDSLISDEEIRLSRDVKAIFNRFSIAITAGTGVYTIPDNVFSISHVTWEGQEIANAELADFQGDPYYNPEAVANRATRPDYYLLTNYGYNQIQFHPTPAVSIAENTANLYNSTNAGTGVIITCFRIADTSGDAYRLPAWMLRNVIKYRAMQRAYAREGASQDLNASKYFKQKADWIEDTFKKVYAKIPKVILDDTSQSTGRRSVPRPQLPTTGPWSFG